MEFKTEPQKKVYEKVAKWLREIFGEQAMARDDAPMFGITLGSALTQIGVFPWGDDDATITAFSYVVSGAELSLELLRFLLEENDQLRFGAFALDKDGDIVFQHTIVGSTCDKEELRASVFAVLKMADDYDDKIVSRYGGARALDRFR